MIRRAACAFNVGLVRPAAGEEGMDEHLTGTWEEFEAWVKETIRSDFRRRVRPQDTPSNREMVASLVLDGIERNEGVFRQSNASIERV